MGGRHPKWALRGPDCDCGECSRRYVQPGELEARHEALQYEKYSSSLDKDSGLMQTDFFSGTVGERDQKKKVHVAINEYGDVVFVRDMDGTVLYDKKNNIGHLPHDLNWSRF